MSLRSDPQRDRVYAIEHTFGRPAKIDNRGISLTNARRVVRSVCRAYNVRPVTIRYENRLNEHHGAYMLIPDGALVVNGAHNRLDLRILLHELAHWIDYHYFGDEVEAHGASFCGIIGWLYDKYRVIPAKALRRLYKDARVRFRQIAACSPERLRARGKVV